MSFWLADLTEIFLREGSLSGFSNIGRVAIFHEVGM